MAFCGVAFIVVTYFWVWGMLILSFFAACASYWEQKKYLMTLVVGFIVVVFFFGMLSGVSSSLNCFYLEGFGIGRGSLVCILGG